MAKPKKINEEPKSCTTFEPATGFCMKMHIELSQYLSWLAACERIGNVAEHKVAKTWIGRTDKKSKHRYVVWTSRDFEESDFFLSERGIYLRLEVHFPGMFRSHNTDKIAKLEGHRNTSRHADPYSAGERQGKLYMIPHCYTWGV
jgi:hypothetical protein